MNPTSTSTPVSLNCKYCGFAISENYYFCPNCGKKLKALPLSTSIGRQLYVYIISALLPPLGLWPGIKYLLDKRKTAKVIGIIAIVLTIASTIITIQLTLKILGGQKDVASQQLQQLENSGY